jgi:integrase
MHRKKGNASLRSVTRIRDPRYPGVLLRVTELKRDGPLFAARQVDGKPRYQKLAPEVTWISLGATNKERVQKAMALALDLIERLATEPDEPDGPSPDGKLTLDELIKKYEVDGLHGRTKRYRDGMLKSVKRVRDFLGADLPVTEIRPSHVQKFMAHRKEQGVLVAGRADMVMLSIVINWAVGEELLEVNPLASKQARQAMHVDHKPRRPVVEPERYEKLKSIAGKMPPAFGVLLDLAWHCGHRVSAMLGDRDGEFQGLRWRDVSFKAAKTAPHGSITWYAGIRPDKKKHEHVVAMNQRVSETLARWQRETGGVGGFVFADPRDHGKALSYYDAQRWLKQAEVKAGLVHVKQGGWHTFRRGWATARKHLPIQDVAKMGGWTDQETPASIYEQADAATSLVVALHVA